MIEENTQSPPQVAPDFVLHHDVRLARVEDLVEPYLLQPVPEKHQGKMRPRWGQPYYIRSIKTGRMDAGAKIIGIDTDIQELKEQFRNQMIYVPCSYFDTPATTEF